MTSVYVLSHSWQDYEAGGSTPVFATSSMDKAEAKKVEMEGRQVVRNQAMESIMAHMRGWDTHNPRPPHGNWRDKPMPIFKGKRKTWTPEQKAEYKKVEEENQEGRSNAIKPLMVWSHQRMAEEKRFTGELPLQVQEDLNNIDGEAFWEIMEIPYEE